MSPLTYAAWYGDNVIVKILIKEGAKVDAKSAMGMTPLMYASWNRRNATVKLLLQHDADADALDDNGRTARAYANLPAIKIPPPISIR